MKYLCGWLAKVSILLAACTGCGPNSTEHARLCEVQIGKAIVEIQGITSRSKASIDRYEAYKDNLRSTVGRCAVSTAGIKVTGNTTISELEVYVMAGLDEEVHSRLELIELMSEVQKASLLMVASRFGSLPTLAKLIEAGVDATLTDSLGNNAISETAGSPLPAEAKIDFLFRHGVDPLARSSDNFSALDAAILADDVDVTGKILSIISISNPRHKSSVEESLQLARRAGSSVERLLELWLATT